MSKKSATKSTRTCFMCERELEEDRYVRSTAHKGRKYCLPGEGCWVFNEETETKDEQEQQNELPQSPSAPPMEATSVPASSQKSTQPKKKGST